MRPTPEPCVWASYGGAGPAPQCRSWSTQWRYLGVTYHSVPVRYHSQPATGVGDAVAALDVQAAGHVGAIELRAADIPEPVYDVTL